MERWIDSENGSEKQEQPAPAEFIAYLRERDAELRTREQQIEMLEQQLHALNVELATFQQYLIDARVERDALRLEVEAAARVRVERDVLRHEFDRLVQLAAPPDDHPRRTKRGASEQSVRQEELRSTAQYTTPPQRQVVPREQQGLFARLFTKQE